MFDIAWSELLLIAVVALIFIGPKELPAVLRNLGRMAAKLRRSADDFRRQFEDSMREAGYEDLHQNLQDIRSLNPGSQLKSGIERAIAQDYVSQQPAPVETAASGTVETAVPAPVENAGPMPAENTGPGPFEEIAYESAMQETPPAGAAPEVPNGHAVAAAPTGEHALKPSGESSKDHAAPVA
jgi:sec-independent protein translocase protein TatB